jgi:hypothetical protein
MTAITATATVPASPARELPRMRRLAPRMQRLALSLGVGLLVLSSIGLAAPGSAAAATGVATSYGFECSANHWVQNNFPNMTSISGAIEKTYFRADLYRWNGSTWVFVASRGWYAGASNGNGKLALGNFFGVPYYWLLNNGAVIDQGAVFSNLQSGYYKTAEYYQWQNGAKASRWSFVNGSGAQYCYIA